MSAEKITAMLRWNALVMVMRANVKYGELGGHIASYASCAEIFEMGFNHFFKGGGGYRGGNGSRGRQVNPEQGQQEHDNTQVQHQLTLNCSDSCRDSCCDSCRRGRRWPRAHDRSFCL